jgi:Zn-dependent peptidase ImmA (M78 family)
MTQSFNYSKAENKAKSTLDDCGLDDPTGIPISEIILSRKAFYYEKPLVGKEGKTVTFADRSIITINSDIDFEPKKRFASAHELGHYEMHRKLVPIFIDTEEDLINWYKAGPQEMAANEFASEFLMPSELFAKECERKKFSPSVIEHLASRFKVSKSAAILKFVKRGNHPVFIVYCKDNKMRWWKKSDDFLYYSKFESDTEPPAGTVAYELFTTNKVYFGDEKKQDIWKSDWFEMKDDEHDKRFYEYCLYVKSYNYTISVIWED